MKNYKLRIQITEGNTELEKNINLQAENPQELSQKINSLKVLSEAIEHEDLMSTVELIHDKPKLIPVVMLRLPKYIKQVMKVLKS